MPTHVDVADANNTTWWEHSAVGLVAANPEFGLIRYQAFECVLRQLAEWQVAMAVFAGLVTVFTLFLELGFPSLVWTQHRPHMADGTALLHLGSAIMMELAVFGLYMFALLLAFFPARLIRERVAVAPASGRRITVRYDSRDPAPVKKAALIKSLDVAVQVTFTDTAGKRDTDPMAHLTDPEGREVTGPDLTRTAFRELALLRPVRWLGAVPGVHGAVNAWFGR